MKIVSLFPAASEIICQLGFSEQLYGVSHECDYPEIVKEKICVTSSFIPKTTDQSLIGRLIKEAIEKNIPLYEIDDKKISDIGPDLIITQGLCQVCSITENRLEVKIKKSLFYIGHKTKIISLNGTTFDEICSDIIMIGKAVKAEEKARNLVEKAILKKNKFNMNRSSKRILLLEWIDPYFTPGHWIPEQIEMAGFMPCVGIKGEKSYQISYKEIVDLNPDYIGLICCGYNIDQNREFAQKLYMDHMLKNVNAIQKEKVYAFNSNFYFSRPTLRILDGVEQLKSAFLNNNPKYHCKKKINFCKL